MDAQVAPFAHRIRPSGVDRLVEEAIVRFMPDRGPDAAGRPPPRPARPRRTTDQVSFAGTMWVEAELDLADALDLDTALSRRRRPARRPRLDESLDVRRSEALGDIARDQLALDLDAHRRRAPTTHGPDPAREVVLHVHLSDAAITAPHRREAAPGAGGEHPLAGRPPTRSGTWCGDPDTTSPSSRSSTWPSTSTSTRTRSPTGSPSRPRSATAPVCSRGAPAPPRHCDNDHVIPYAEGGADRPATTCPLCRRHHRLKTHHPGWHYTILEPGGYLWSSPTATSSSATTPAPPTSPAADLPPARPVATPPHTPREHNRDAGRHRHVAGEGEGPRGDNVPPSLRPPPIWDPGERAAAGRRQGRPPGPDSRAPDA